MSNDSNDILQIYYETQSCQLKLQTVKGHHGVVKTLKIEMLNDPNFLKCMLLFLNIVNC